MTTTELIELLKKYERGGATGHPREVMFEVDGRIIDTDDIEVIAAGDGLISELYLSLPSARSEIAKGINVLSKDYISRQVAIDLCDKVIERDKSGENVVVEAMKAWKACMLGLPSKQPEWKRDKGEWIIDPFQIRVDKHVCSKCRHLAPAIITGSRLVGDVSPSGDTGGHWVYDEEIFLSDFCPYCGADMRGERNDNEV